MIRCSNCGTQLEENVAVCPECSTPVADDQAFQCSRCGSEIVGGDACPACGVLRAERACENHPSHRAIGRCVICARALCPKCADEQKHVVLCEAHRSIPIIEGWAQVYSTTSEVEARLLCENLRVEGIEAQVFSQKDMMFNVDLGELSIVRLLVPVWEYGAALQMIHGHMDVEGEVAFACVACGEPFESGARECASCGAMLV